MSPPRGNAAVVHGAALADAEATAEVLVTLVLLRVGDGYALQLRDLDADIAAPGEWGLFGGTVEPGEAPTDAARREVEEELAISVDPSPCPFGVFDAHQPFHRKSACALVFRADATAVWGRYVLREGQRVQVFDPGELSTLEPVGEFSRVALEEHLGLSGVAASA